MLLSLLVACHRADPEAPDTEGPLGISLAHDGKMRAGVARVELTPEIVETFVDVDGNADFNGRHDDPDGAEPFDDVDGDGWFDAVWIGGYGPMRPANGVHDPTWARAIVLAVDGEYVALVSLDLVGLGHTRIWEARDRLADAGFDPDRLVVASTHDHDGADTMGLWGDPILMIPGFDPAYQQRVVDAIDAAVREAAASMEEVDLKVGSVRMRDRSPWLNGEYFGGKNPDPRFHGMIHDGRDPVVVSDQLLVLQGNAADHTVFTMTNWSGHPEVRGSHNNDISSDWPGVTRDILEAEYGGIAVHFPESLGGMQSALNGQLPLVEADGTHVMATCDAAAVADAADVDCFGKTPGADRVDADGDRVPVWAETDSWAFVTSHGWHIAEAAIDALAVGEPVAPALKVGREAFLLPVTNFVYNAWGPLGLFDFAMEQVVSDEARCPETNPPDVMGCYEPHVFRVEIGRTGPGTGIGLLTAPGELFPELAWGFPEDDPDWAPEANDPTRRGVGATFFPQHDPDCNSAIGDYEECRDTSVADGCDCLSIHAWPYRLSDADHPPLLDALDTKHKAMMSMTDSYFSYVVPEPDFNHFVTLLSDDGDHYEDTVSAASVFADRVFEAHERLDARW